MKWHGGGATILMSVLAMGTALPNQDELKGFEDSSNLPRL
jgi:hypothetical protein